MASRAPLQLSPPEHASRTIRTQCYYGLGGDAWIRPVPVRPKASMWLATTAMDGCCSGQVSTCFGGLDVSTGIHAVGGVVFLKDGRVLLIRRGQPPLEGTWTLPGG